MQETAERNELKSVMPLRSSTRSLVFLCAKTSTKSIPRIFSVVAFLQFTPYSSHYLCPSTFEKYYEA